MLDKQDSGIREPLIEISRLSQVWGNSFDGGIPPATLPKKRQDGPVVQKSYDLAQEFERLPKKSVQCPRLP